MYTNAQAESATFVLALLLSIAIWVLVPWLIVKLAKDLQK